MTNDVIEKARQLINQATVRPYRAALLVGDLIAILKVLDTQHTAALTVVKVARDIKYNPAGPTVGRIIAAVAAYDALTAEDL